MSAPASNANLAIRASAGTGKTFQLSDRIIGLLLRKEVKPEQIAALTFTRAAAAEFVVRVVSKLKQAADADDNAALRDQPKEVIEKNERVDLCHRLKLDYRQYDRGRFQELLRSTLLASNRLTMGTLDGFFAKLVNNFSLEVGISSGVATTVPDSEADKNRLEALSFALQGADRERQAQLLAALADYNDEKNSASPIENLLKMAKNHHELYTLSPEESKWGQEQLIWGNQPPVWAGYAKKTEDGQDWAVFDHWINETFIEVMPKALETLKSAVACGRASSGDAGAILNILSPLLQAQAGVPVSLSYDGDPYPMTAEQAAAGRNVALGVVDRLVTARFRQTRALYACLRSYEEAYQKINREGGRLGFSDYVTLLLATPELDKLDIEYRLDCTIKHWLLDEFQDTGTQQFDVLKRNLAEIISAPPEDRTVFVVGDPKQSLYEWRSGNRRLLTEVGDDIVAGGGVLKPMDETRRCSPPVLDLVNAALGNLSAQLFAVKPGETEGFSPLAAAEWAEVFSEQKAIRPTSGVFPKGESSWIKLPKVENEDDCVTQAKWIAAHLDQASGGIIGEDGRLRPGMTCAILVSKNDDATVITDTLRREGIEATDEAKLSAMKDNPTTVGLIGLLHATVHSDNGLPKGFAEMSPPANAFIRSCGGWPLACARIASTFAAKGAEALVNELTAGIDYADDRGFIRKRIGQFRTLAANYDREGERDLEGFIAYCENTQMRDKADPRTVQVITIHRSKGLEYDVVYMPRLNDSKIRMSQPRSGQLLTLLGPDFKPSWLLCSPGEAVTRLDERLAAAQAEAKAESGYGSLCKVYVGMTRAKHRLVMISNELSRNQQASFAKNESTYDIALFLEKVLPDKPVAKLPLTGQPIANVVWTSDANDDGWIAARIAAEEKKAAKLGALVKPQAIDASGFKPATRLKRVLPSAGEKQFTRAWQPQTEEAKGTAFGTVVHGYFAHLAWDADAFLTKIAALPWDEVSVAVKAKALERIQRCLAVPEVRQLLLTKPSKDALLWCERDAVLRNANGEFVSCQFDRVHIVPGKKAVIFDFKTDGGTLAKLLKDYRRQMGMYREAVAQLTGLKLEQVEVYLVHAHANNPGIAKVEF